MKWHLLLTRLGWAAVWFRPRRADYYEYLANKMTVSEGRQSIRGIFERDARRYGPRTARGILSTHWAYQIAETGNLESAFTGTLPAEDVALIGNLQQIGAQALIEGLHDLAELTRLRDRLGNILRSTLWAAGVALLLLGGMLLVAIPYFTVPQLQAAFEQVPTEQLGPLARRLFHLADWMRAYPLGLAAAIAAVLGGTTWALPNLRGPIRRWLDHLGPFRLYRDLTAIRVIATLAIAMRRRAAANLALVDAIAMQMNGASPWLADHLARTLYRLTEADAGVAAFDTGLMDRDTYWYLEDAAEAGGLDSALQRTREQLQTRTVTHVARRAAALRWVVLLSAVGALIGLMFWHYGAVFELRNQMLLSGV